MRSETLAFDFHCESGKYGLDQREIPRPLLYVQTLSYAISRNTGG